MHLLSHQPLSIKRFVVKNRRSGWEESESLATSRLEALELGPADRMRLVSDLDKTEFTRLLDEDS